MSSQCGDDDIEGFLTFVPVSMVVRTSASAWVAHMV
jgi:hypothetical protein